MSERNYSFSQGGQEKPEKVRIVNDGGERSNKPYKISSIVLIVMAVILAAVIFAIVNKSYTVSNIVINGSAPYTKETLVQFATEYCEGKNAGSFFYVDETELAERFRSAFPYLKEAKVEKKTPNTLIITVAGEEARAYFFMLDAYYVINENMKILEKTDARPTIPALIELAVSVPKEMEIGKQPTFSEGVAADTETFIRLYNSIIDNGLRYDVVSIRAESKFELAMTLRSGTDVKIGSVKDVEDKIAGLKKWMDENPSMLGPKVNVDITIVKKISITYD